MTHAENNTPDKEDFENVQNIDSIELEFDKTDPNNEVVVNEASHSEVQELKMQMEELRKKILYQQAEFDNFRKRSAREKQDTILTASRDTMTALLPVIDDFDRAAKNGALNEGTILIYNKLVHIATSKGLKAMESAPGSDFNSDEHEAITEITAGDAFIGKIVETVEKGYFLNEKLIRHAKVVVGR